MLRVAPRTSVSCRQTNAGQTSLQVCPAFFGANKNSRALLLGAHELDELLSGYLYLLVGHIALVLESCIRNGQ